MEEPASSSYELGSVAVRRASRSESFSSHAWPGISSVVSDYPTPEPHDETTATVSTYDLGGVSIASRRASRSEAGRPAFGPLSTLDTVDEPRKTSFLTSPAPLETPPDTPPDKSAVPTTGEFFPPQRHEIPEPSLPPTPNEPAFWPDIEEVPTPPGEKADSTADLNPHLATGVDDTTEREVTSLHPVDRGRDAILFLVAATLIDAIVWGLPYSVGVLHEYWAHMFPNAESTLTLASTLPTGLLFFSGALLGPLFAAFPWYERHIQIFGLVVSTGGLVATAYVTQPWQIVLTFGILYSVAGAIYLPCATIIFEWFQTYRGLATGIMYAGTGVGGSIYPFVVTALLKKLGYRGTMLAIAFSYLVINAGCLVYIKRRIPIAQSWTHGPRRRSRPKIDWSFLRYRAPWIAFAFMLLSSLANFIPFLWLPSYASAVNATKPDGAALLAIMNAITIPGITITGYISDRMKMRYAIIGSTTLAALSCALLWGFGTTSAVLLGFAIVWGFTGGSFVGFWAIMITKIADGDPNVPALVLSIFISLKGVGSLTSGPLSTALLQCDAFRGAAGAYGETNYGVLLIFTSAMTFFSGLTLFGFPE